MAGETERRGERILIVAPLGRDAAMLAATLSGADLAPEVCVSVAEVMSRVLVDAGVVLLTEEVLTPPAITLLLEALEAQPPWSDVPVIVLTAGGRRTEPSVRLVQSLQRLGNVTLLERPIRVVSLLSAVESAVRARRRQYEVRDHLVERSRRADEAASESRAKDEFLAMLGHELRNPLGAISAAAHLLQSSSSAAEGDGSALARRVIVRQLRHITRLVDDLLDVSRVTSGKIELTRHVLDAGVATANCVAAVRGTGAADHHQLEVKVESVFVNADEVRFDQIVSNLVVNALRYTPPGGRVEVAVARRGADAVITVRDSGIGIASELLPRIFDLFVQGGRAIERKQGGLGIGLTLVRRLVELHGGTVGVESAGPQQGSTFTVRLPAMAAPAEVEHAATRAERAVSRRIVLVEDNDDSREVMALALRGAGHEVHEAANGVAGLELALRERPDVAVIDVGLPGLSGYEVAQRLRADAGTRDAVLVALTGYGLPEDRRRASDAGFDLHLVKPVDFDQLLHVLAAGRPAAA